MTDTNKLAQYVANWQDERNGAALYRAISELEKNPQLKKVYQRLGEAEERHSCFWEAKLRAASPPLPPFRLNWRTRTLIFLAQRFGPAFVLPNIEPLEEIDSHKYDLQPEAQAGGLPQQEQSHARLLQAITSGSRAGLEGSRIAQLEGRHRAIGGNPPQAPGARGDHRRVADLGLGLGGGGGAFWGAPGVSLGVARVVSGGAAI